MARGIDLILVEKKFHATNIFDEICMKYETSNWSKYGFTAFIPLLKLSSDTNLQKDSFLWNMKYICNHAQWNWLKNMKKEYFIF